MRTLKLKKVIFGRFFFVYTFIWRIFVTIKHPTTAISFVIFLTVYTCAKPALDEPRSGGKKQGGLRNIGNSCYLNSVLQCVLHCEPLRSYIVNGRYKGEVNRKSKTAGNFHKAFQLIIYRMVPTRPN